MILDYNVNVTLNCLGLGLEGKVRQPWLGGQEHSAPISPTDDLQYGLLGTSNMAERRVYYADFTVSYLQRVNIPVRIYYVTTVIKAKSNQ